MAAQLTGRGGVRWLGQKPNFFRKCVLRAPLRVKLKTTAISVQSVAILEFVDFAWLHPDHLCAPSYQSYPTYLPHTLPLDIGHPGGNPGGPHGPPVAVLTEWGPPSVRWQAPTGGSIYKIDAPDPAIPTTYCGKHIPTHACQINPKIYQR